jgi:hypothetical protein
MDLRMGMSLQQCGENKRAAAYIERTSAQICETMSLALTSGMGKGSKRDKARAMDGGVGSLISIKVTNGLPLQRYVECEVAAIAASVGLHA